MCLMKRKYDDGIKLFTKLINKKPKQLEEYWQHFYMYRAFGYICKE